MRIGVVGLGVIGASFCMGLKEAKYNDVYGIDISEDTIKKAKNMGIIKEGYLNGDEIVKSLDVIILAIYPKLVEKFIIENKKNFKKGLVITDTTGIKKIFVEKILKILPEDVDFVFGHPMAGREKKGIDFSSSEVFKGANYIITPTEVNKEKNIELIEKIAIEIGFKKIKKISYEYHDEMIAFTSQLPHAIAVSLVNSDIEGRDTGSFIGDSYRDLTRIANINEELWSELFIGNKENLIDSIDSFVDEIIKLREAIKLEDKKSLCEIFIKSSNRRELL